MAAKKVGRKSAEQNDAEASGRKTRKKAPREEYKYADMVDADGNSVVNEDGLLTMMPPEIKDDDGTVTQAAFHPKTHAALKKSDFVDEATFFLYRAHVADFNAQRQQDLADSFRKRAKTLKQFGDEKTRKKASKLQKMQEQMAALKAELGAEGIDLEDLLGDGDDD